jgi:hypothetical protein
MKHRLDIISHHDAQARCFCGGWNYSFTGFKTPTELMEEWKKHIRAIRNKARRDRDDAYRSLGMKKVRGNLGGIYWE